MAANPTATFQTSMGNLEFELYLDKMPLTVSNFIDLANTGFYNGLSFHRVIPKFMLQFGCPYSKPGHKMFSRAGTGGPDANSTFKNLATGATERRDRGGNIKDELTQRITNAPGTLSMANTGQPNSGGSQFFINTVHNRYLDWFDRSSQSKHPVFGRITTQEGLDLCVKIGKVKTRSDKPLTDVIVKKIVIDMKGAGGGAAAGPTKVAKSNPANPVACFNTSMGTFKCELYEDKMPITVGNFVDLCEKKFYNNLTFHRVIAGFMLQFGCPFSSLSSKNRGRAGTGGPKGGTKFSAKNGKTYTRDRGGNIPDEFAAKITNAPGTLSMANTGQPNSGGSQFFVNVADNAYLDWFDKRTQSKHPVFGKCIENYELVVQISKVRVNKSQGDRPVQDVVMKSITIEK